MSILEIENPIIKGEHKSFQFNDYMDCNTYYCLNCKHQFNSCEEGLDFDGDTYCSLDCLINDLTENGLLKEI